VLGASNSFINSALNSIRIHRPTSLDSTFVDMYEALELVEAPQQ
jgi:hypothetical protein